MSVTSLTGRRMRLRDMVIDDVPAWKGWLMQDHAWHRLDGLYYPKPTTGEITGMVAAARANVQAGDWPKPRATSSSAW